MSTTHYTIGTVAKRYGITTVTLRHYQKIGLLHPSFRGESGYRVYKEEDLSRLHFILNTKNAGFTLEEIKALFFMIDNGEPNKAVKNLIHEKLKSIQEKILHLQKLTILLEDLDNVCHKQMAARDCPIIKRLRVNPSAIS
ncbi:MAG: MerR family transcriptional regulator [Gammaproteobacteria bacterium]|nr:MerR family transcriptional regulator [Gammaproteobacteria bacterium]